MLDPREATLAREDGDGCPLPNAVHVGGLDRTELLRALRARDVRVNEAAAALFEDPRFRPESRERLVGIALRAVAALGFAAGATHAQILARALESGLAECPLELGPHLRLQYLQRLEAAHEASPSRGQAPPGSITVMSPPLDDRDETPKGFYLRRVDGVSWLRGYWSSPGHVWAPGDLLVFARASA